MKHLTIKESIRYVIENLFKVPQRFIDHAHKVGSTVGFAEITYRQWSRRGLSTQQILDKITAHGEKLKRDSHQEIH